MRSIASFAAAGLLLVVAGCGSAPVTDTVEESDNTQWQDPVFVDVRLETPNKVEDRVQKELAQLDRTELDRFVRRHINLLETVHWEYAAQQLRRVGPAVIPYLIQTLDDTHTPTAAAQRPRPGPSQMLEERTYKKADVAYSLLRQLVALYSNRANTVGAKLPPRNREAWEAWYDAYGNDMIVYGYYQATPLKPQRAP